MLNYKIEGEGPPLLLCHGFGISFNIWKELSPILRKRIQLVIVELPGIGSSPIPPAGESYLSRAVEELELLRSYLNIPRWTVLGYSSGSRVIEAYLQIHGIRVERAIFLCPAYVSKGTADGLRIAISLDKNYPSLGNYVLTGSRIRFLIRLLAFNLRHNPQVDKWYREISTQPMEILKETLRLLPEGGAHKFVVPDQIPALFIWGNRDWITANPHPPCGRDVIIEATHSAPQTSADEVAKNILTFIKMGNDH